MNDIKIRNDPKNTKTYVKNKEFIYKKMTKEIASYKKYDAGH
jgi:hypothetical protein